MHDRIVPFFNLILQEKYRKKIYNDFSNITKENRERFNIEIKEVSLEKENNDSLDISKDDMELII